MSTLTLTIGGVNFLPQYKTGTARITEQLQNRSNSLSLQLTRLPSSNDPQEGAEIILKDGARFLFAGFVTRVEPTENGKGSQFIYRIEATDYTYVLINKNAQAVYKNKTMKYIVQDLLSQYVNAGYSLSLIHI